MTSLANRKRTIKARTTTAKRISETGKNSFIDPNEWKLAKNKAGNGRAVIRFLEPSDADISHFMASDNLKEEEVSSFVTQYDHGFQGVTGKWFIENCPTIHKGGKCPVCEETFEIINKHGGYSNIPENSDDFERVKSNRRRTKFIANILVIEDSENPENEGKVKVFKFGKYIKTMIDDELLDRFETGDACDVSNFWEGKNYNFKMITKNKRISYEKSDWSSVSELGTDEEIEEIIKKLHPLHKYVAPDQYKSYDELAECYEDTKVLKVTAPKKDNDADDDIAADSPTKPTAPIRRKRDIQIDDSGLTDTPNKPEPDNEDDYIDDLIK